MSRLPRIVRGKILTTSIGVDHHQNRNIDPSVPLLSSPSPIA